MKCQKKICIILALPAQLLILMRMDKKNYQQVYLEECKYRVKKIQMSRFISTELESDSDSDSEAESKSETELMRKLESGSKL